jgi:PAS domain S-box-containing protein
MTGSIHRGTTSEPQDRSSSAAHSIAVPSEIVRKWQELVNLLAEIMHVPSASIMRVDPPHIKVFVSSTSEGNPCEPGALDTGPYCETVMKTGQPLLVPDALENEAWKANPHVRLGMISYLGVPIAWPDGRLFGTICVRDNKRNEYSGAYLKLLLHFRDMLQADLKSLARLHGEIEEREAKIRRLVDANIIGIIIWDLEGRILEANDAFLSMGGYDREDLIAGRLNRTDLTPPEWRQRDARIDAELKMIGAVQPFETEYFRKDGGRVPVLIGLAAFGEERDQGVAFVLDLTARNRAEVALRESEYRLRQIIDTVPTLLWSAGPDGEPTHVSQRLLDYSGMRLEDFKHGGWEAFVHPADFPETARAFYHAIQTGTSYQAVHRLRRAADGEYRWHHARGEPLQDREGRIVQWYGLSVDIDEGKKAEDRLRRSEAYLALSQRLTHTGSWAASNPTTPLYWSDECCRIFGFDPLQGPPKIEEVWQRIHPHERDRVSDEAQRALREKRDYSVAYRIVVPPGTVRHIESTARHLFAGGGELVEIVGTIIDVTERKRADDALRESEAKFRDYAETASDWHWEIDPDYKFTLLSENAFGSGAADRIGTTCWDHALDVEAEPEKWRLVGATLDSHKPFRDFVYRGLDGTGSPMYVKASGKPVFDANGEFRGYRGTGTDVTALMRAQEALRESERSARSAIDGIAGLVSIHFPNGEVETVNRQCLEYFGRSLEELRNWGTSDAVHPEDLPRILELFKRAIASGISFNFDQRLRRFDGEYRWFTNRGVPIRDDSGRIARWYVLLTDIEDSTRTLAQLEQVQSDLAHMNRVATMGHLTASITHEVNQPVTAAVTYALAARRLLNAEPPNFREVDDALSLVVKEGYRVGEVVERVRALIKKLPARKDAVTIDDAILEVIALTRAEAANNSVSVRTQFTEGLPCIQGDRVQLQQVMLNLIVNAIQAMSGVGEDARELQISIEAVPSEGSVRVGVQDTGPGLSPESLSRLFEPFYTTKPEGMGMGLSICRSIIEAHGGRLWATAREPRGALFQFTIPVD